MELKHILHALGGSFFLVAIWLKAEKQKRDTTNVKYKWLEYFTKEWDDWAFAVICGYVMGVYLREFYLGAVLVMSWDPVKAWSIYKEMWRLIAFGSGVFGTFIIKSVYELVMALMLAFKSKLMSIAGK